MLIVATASGVFAILVAAGTIELPAGNAQLGFYAHRKQVNPAPPPTTQPASSMRAPARPSSSAPVQAGQPIESAASTPPPKLELPKVTGVPWNAPATRKTPSCSALVGADGEQPPAFLLKQALERGEAEMRRGNLAKAQMAYCEAKVLGDTSATLLYALAHILLLQHDAEGVLRVADEILERTPNDPVACDLRGDALIRMGRVSDARTAWLRAVGASRSSELVLHNLLRANQAAAISALDSKDLIYADRVLRRVIALDPHDARAAAELAGVLWKSGERRAAGYWLAYAVGLDEAHPSVLAMRKEMGG